MQGLKFPFLARFNAVCTFILAGSVFVLLLIAPLITAGEAKAELIDFSEFPEGTVITSQYRDLGVVFSGVSEDLIISTPPSIFGSGLSPALSSGCGMAVTFVIPGSDTTAEATSYRFSSYLQSFSSEAYIFTFYPTDGEPIVKTWWDLFNIWDWPTVPVYKIFMEPAGSGCTNHWIEDLSFRISCNGTDADGDGHYSTTSCLTPNDDCDDTDPAIPGAEICTDGKDNDCDGDIDCIDSECSTNQQCYPPDCSPTMGAPSSYVGE